MDTIGIIVLSVIVAVAAFIVIALLMRRGRHLDSAALKARFGPEYDRAIAEHESLQSGEDALRRRVEAVRKLDIRPLAADEHARFTSDWRRVQERFLDAPRQAVDDGHALVELVMSTRGYPVHEFEEQVELLSVDHAEVVQHYRAARALAHARRGTHAETEDLRQAMVHYRALLSDLLVSDEPRPHDGPIHQPQPQW